jgi:hypothetical protein
MNRGWPRARKVAFRLPVNHCTNDVRPFHRDIRRKGVIPLLGRQRCIHAPESRIAPRCSILDSRGLTSRSRDSILWALESPAGRGNPAIEMCTCCYVHELATAKRLRLRWIVGAQSSLNPTHCDRNEFQLRFISTIDVSDQIAVCLRCLMVGCAGVVCVGAIAAMTPSVSEGRAPAACAGCDEPVCRRACVSTGSDGCERVR